MEMPSNTDSPVDTLIVPRTSDLGDNFHVRRALPSRERRMVGPFVFLDEMGPAVFRPGKGLDVRPHPHIGLSTVTYLFEGEILHRDSLGTVQPIQPGEVNWMTAGRGIVHSERTGPDLRATGHTLSGLQCWVALPRDKEESEPGFTHITSGELPVEEGEGIFARVVAGSFLGKQSPVPVSSAMFYTDCRMSPGARFVMPAEYAEQALYVVRGRLEIEGAGNFDAGRLVVLKPGSRATLAASSEAVHLMLLGGEPLEGPRYLNWNFVSSRTERIERARADWRDARFPTVPGETEWIPLPEQPASVRYP